MACVGIDVNECNTDNGGCDHICTNREGDYQCSCRTGFSLRGDNRTCDDIDECVVNMLSPCSDICINTNGSFLCDCPSGFALGIDNRNCFGMIRKISSFSILDSSI